MEGYWVRGRRADPRTAELKIPRLGVGSVTDDDAYDRYIAARVLSEYGRELRG